MPIFRPSVAVSPKGLAAAVDTGESRISGGESIGSRGSRTYAKPPGTKLALDAAPIARSMTDKREPGPAPHITNSHAAALSMLTGWRGLLVASLIATSLGSIFGFGAVADVIAVLLQFAIVGGVVYWGSNFIRSRLQPASGTSPDAEQAQPGDNARNLSPFTFSGGPAPLAADLTIGKDDFDSFERLLEEIQAAYSREDIADLGARTTPEMLSYFSRDLYDNEQRGLRDDISGVKLLRGDLSEAWRENRSDYATLAIRYSLVAITVDRKTGAVVSGDPGVSSQAVELWTFRRDDRAREEGWQLSAIQQAVSPRRSMQA